MATEDASTLARSAEHLKRSDSAHLRRAKHGIITSVANDRLTRQELSWLLAQEARGAAKALREGVALTPSSGEASIATFNAPLIIEKNPQGNILSAPSAEQGVATRGEATIDALGPTDTLTTLAVLDDAISLLSDLQAAPTRRGRIDLAALLFEVAPDARITIAPGAGSEVFGEETGLKRMLQVLVSRGQSHLGGGTPELTLRREGAWIYVEVELGPETVVAEGPEQRWLSRMATRQGGRLELEGGTQALILPAEGSADELGALRKELEQAQQLGEAYAKELAAVFAAADPSPPSAPEKPTVGELHSLIAFSKAVLHPLRSILPSGPLDGDLQATGEAHKIRRENNDNAASLSSSQVLAGVELMAELKRFAEILPGEAPEELDLVQLVSSTLSAAKRRGDRHEVQLTLSENPAPPQKALVKFPPGQIQLLLRTLLDHAIAATPKTGAITVRIISSNNQALVQIQDGGPNIPQASHAGLLSGLLDPSSVGRPTGLWLPAASCLAAELKLELSLLDQAAFWVQLKFPLSAWR